jgi:gliding motility-associated-like protein
MKRSLLCYIAIMAFTLLLSSEMQGQEIQILDIRKTDATCSNTDDGTITISVTGGTKPYVYHIIHGTDTRNSAETSDTVFTFTMVWATNWNIVVEDDLNIADFGSVWVNEPAPISISSAVITPISCTGFGDGMIRVTASGESGTYNFTLNPTGTSNTTGFFTGLSPNTYTVDVADATGCPTTVLTGALIISDPLPVTVNSAAATDVTCNGLANGTINVSGSGGTGGYLYTLNPGAIAVNSSGNFNGVNTGGYTVNITDGNACPSVNTSLLTISEPTAISGSLTSQTNVICFGSNTGSATVSGSGGTGSYTYNIDGGAFGASATFNSLFAGSHNVKVKDANGCTANVAVIITQPASAVSGNITSQTNLLCFGSGTGSVTVSGSGGTGSYAFNIDGGVFGASGTFNGLAAGAHTVQVKDANSCIANVAVNIFQPAVLSGSITSQTNALCFGTSTGSVTVAGTGGTVAYSYNIDGGVFGASGTFPGLAAGAHTVQVKDANSCTANVAVTISQPSSAVSGNISSQTDALCFGSNSGSVSVAGSGGTVAYTFNIDGGAFGASGTFSGLAAGSHSVQVKDANSCLADLPVIINQPAVLSMVLSKTDITCYGLANGTVTITASGGISPYTYSKTPSPYQVSNVLSGLTKNTYSINTKDANGCISTSAITINEPAELLIPNEIRINNNVCFGDSLSEIRILSTTGGVTPYNYSIDGGLNFYTSGIFQNLPAGGYQTVVRDANGCLENGKLNNIYQPGKIFITDYAQVDAADCYGSLNGQIAIEAAGGTGVITYNLDGLVFNTTGFFESVGGGNHLVTMTDINSCSIDTSVSLNQPSEQVFAVLNITDVTGCTGNSNAAVDAAAGGGAGLYNYSLNDGAFQASGNFSGLTAGNFKLSVQDANTCVKDTNIVIAEPAPVGILSDTSVNVTCVSANDGSISITGAGGTAPYTYILKPGAVMTNNTGNFTSLGPGTYSVEVNDTPGCGPVSTMPITITEPAGIVRDSVVSKEITCAGSDNAEIHIFASGGTSPYIYSIDNGTSYTNFRDLTGLEAGLYLLSLKDANGCTLNLDTLNFTEPPAIMMVSETGLDIVSCSSDNTGQVDYVVSGGTGSIDYSIDLINWQPSGQFTGLNAGNYTVTARDQNLCMLNSSNLTIVAPAAITADITTTPDLNEFNKGTLRIANASGGTGILKYSISGLSGVFSTKNDYTGLDAGTYPVVVRDDNNCTFEQNALVSLVPLLDVTVTLTNSTCNGDDNASITMVSSNGTASMEYSIDDSTSWVNSGIFTDLGPGTYYIFMRDGMNRYFQDTVMLTEPLAINIFGSITPAKCSSFSNDGAVDVSVNGGKPPYSYFWNSGETSQDLINLNPGNYSISVTDSKDCINEKSFEVLTLISVSANAGPDTALCYGQTFILNGQGGSIMSWAPTEGLSNSNIYNPVVSITSDASYVLTVIGFDDCIDVDTINIIVRPDLGLKASNDTIVIKNQEVTLVATGGPFISYSWVPANGLSTPDQSSTLAHPLGTTNFIVTAVSGFGCSESDTVLVKVSERLTIYDVFSPNNGDDLNNYFEIGFAYLYPDILVEVYTRWGEKLFSSTGYSDEQRWDGTFKGKDVPMGTYYYVIVPYHGAEAFTGPLTIVR